MSERDQDAEARVVRSRTRVRRVRLVPASPARFARRGRNGSVALAAPNPASLLLGGLGLALVPALGSIAQDDLPALGLAVGVLAVPVVIYLLWQALAGTPQVLAWMALAIIVVESGNVRTRDYADKSIDAQVALKLAGLALMAGLAGPLLMRRARNGTGTGLMLWLGWLGYSILTASYAVAPGYAAVAAVSTALGFLLLWRLGDDLGRDRLVQTAVLACFVLCAASVVVYVAVPSLGRMSDWINGAFVPTSRLQGVFGSANAAGCAGAAGLILLVLIGGRPRSRWLLGAMMASFAVCLVLSNNRMALGGTIVAFGSVMLRRGDTALRLAVTAALGTAAAVLAYGWGEALLAALARSGSAEEVLTGTGRTRIWDVVLSLWWEHPFFGLGVTSSGQILPKHELLFQAAAHAHNLYLEVLFSGGLVGLGLLMAAVLGSWCAAQTSGRSGEMALLLFFLVYGLTEPIVNGIIGFPSLCFCLAGLLPHLRPDAVQAGEQAR